LQVYGAKYEAMKRYDQYCPIACSLGLIGERWTLLVVRELLHGPKRYTDLAEHLPGIGTNILAARLKELESGGLVEKRKLPPPWASTVYELTAAGMPQPASTTTRSLISAVSPSGTGTGCAPMNNTRPRRLVSVTSDSMSPLSKA